MNTIIRSPESYELIGNTVQIFMAGTIDNGSAEPWVDRVVRSIVSDKDITFLDPRRKEWNQNLSNDSDNTEFRNQVEWEMGGLTSADIIVFNILPGSLSPVTMLELGWCVSTRNTNDVFVCCPDGFWRKGNVDIFCEFHYVKVFDTEDEMIMALNKRLA